MKKYLYKDLYELEETHWWHKAKRDLVSYYLKQNLPTKKNKILDVGCGTGKNLEAFSRFGTAWGIDSSKEAILFCKRRNLKRAVTGTVEKIPFLREYFECVTTLDVLEHVDDSKSIKEIHRVLKNKGLLIITVPAFPSLWSKWDNVLHHKRRYTKRNLQTLLNRNGFEVLKISYIYSFLFLPALIIRTIKEVIFKHHYPSDFLISNKLINATFGNLSKIERFFIIHGNVLFGTSIIAIARKI